MKANQKGFSVVEILIFIVVVGLLGAAGWFVYERQKNKSDNKETATQASQQEEMPKQEEPKVNVPEGWVKYQDSASGVSLYHPADWDKDKFHVDKVAVSETLKGTNFGSFSAKYVFKKAENKWYAVDSEGNQVAPYSGYTTVTTFPVSTYPAVYGYTGEGGGTSYYAVFTDGNSSYLVELPVIAEETDPNGLDEQKQAIADLVKTIELGN